MIPEESGAAVAFGLVAVYGMILGAALMALLWWLW